MCGCSRPVYNDSSGLTITPGVGISNIVEIGMSRSAIRNATRDLVPIRKQKKNGYRVPSLGLVVFLDENDNVYTIDAVVDLSRHHETSPTRILTPFCGKISGGISFHNEKSVCRTDIVRVFGEPLHPMGNQKDFDIKTYAYINKLSDQGKSYSKYEDWRESLCYPDKGIFINIDDGTVSGFRLYEPVQSSN